MHYMCRKYLLGLLPLATLLAPGGLLAQEIIFEEFYGQLQELERRGEYLQALDMLKLRSASFPENYFTLLKEEIFVLEKLERYSESLDLIREGHRRGCFFFIHPAIPEFEAYRDLQGFDSLSACDLKLRKEAIERSLSIYKVVFPDNFSRGGHFPVCFIFHGGGSNLKRVMEHWRSPTLISDFFRIYVQSYLYYDSETFGWRSGDDRAFREVSDICQLAASKLPLDVSEIYVAGISAGGTFAIDLAIRQIIPARGFITFCPGIPGILQEGQKKEVPAVRGFMVGGEEDFYLPRQLEMVRIFDSLDLSFRHEILPGMGHQYPVDESYWIEQGIQYLRKCNTRVFSNMTFLKP